MLNETSDLINAASSSHFAFADYVIFALMITCSILIGIYVGYKGWNKDTTKDFLVGGRKMHPIPVALSLIGGIVSSLSILGE